jgi:hypothetical protein
MDSRDDVAKCDDGREAKDSTGELDIVKAALRNPVPDFRPLSLCKKGRANPYTGYFLGLLVTSENFPVNNCPSSGSIGKSLTSGGVSCLL